MIVEIETDQGLAGWGECYGPARINAAIVRNMASFLVGQDALRSEWIWQELYARYRDHGQKGYRRFWRMMQDAPKAITPRGSATRFVRSVIGLFPELYWSAYRPS